MINNSFLFLCLFGLMFHPSVTDPSPGSIYSLFVPILTSKLGLLLSVRCIIFLFSLIFHPSETDSLPLTGGIGESPRSEHSLFGSGFASKLDLLLPVNCPCGFFLSGLIFHPSGTDPLFFTASPGSRHSFVVSIFASTTGLLLSVRCFLFSSSLIFHPSGIDSLPLTGGIGESPGSEPSLFGSLFATKVDLLSPVNCPCGLFLSGLIFHPSGTDPFFFTASPGSRYSFVV